MILDAEDKTENVCISKVLFSKYFRYIFNNLIKTQNKNGTLYIEAVTNVRNEQSIIQIGGATKVMPYK